MDRAINTRKWTARNISKATRYVAGELKRRPAFLKGIEGRLSAPDKQLLVDNKEVVAVEDAPQVIQQYDLNPRYGGGRDRLYEHIAREKAGITRRMVAQASSHSAPGDYHKRRR
jgi:hypothetical protein